MLPFQNTQLIVCEFQRGKKLNFFAFMQAIIDWHNSFVRVVWKLISCATKYTTVNVLLASGTINANCIYTLFLRSMEKT